MSVRKRLSRKWFVPFTVLPLLITAVLLLASGPMSQANSPQDTGGPGSEPGLVEQGETPTIDLDAGGADEPVGARPLVPLAPILSYYKVPGVAFQPRNSATAYDYLAGTGCIRRTGGTQAFSTVLPIPDGSVVKYVRIYTHNTASGPAGSGLFTRYNMAGSFTDIVAVSASSAAGYHSALSVEITHTVDFDNYGYVLSWGPDTTQALCGMRVSYYKPSVFGVALPLIVR